MLMCNLNVPSLSLNPYPLVLPLHTLTKSPFPAFLLVSFGYWKAALRSLWRLLQLRLSNPNCLSLTAQKMHSSPLAPLCGPSRKSFKCLHGFLLLGAQDWMQLVFKFKKRHYFWFSCTACVLCDSISYFGIDIELLGGLFNALYWNMIRTQLYCTIWL